MKQTNKYFKYGGVLDVKDNRQEVWQRSCERLKGKRQDMAKDGVTLVDMYKEPSGSVRSNVRNVASRPENCTREEESVV